MTEPIVYKDDGEMLVGSKTLTCFYGAEATYVNLKNASPGCFYEYKKPDYSKMYFEFQFKDGEKARYRMDKDCHDLQKFLDRMNHFHDLEKENKRLREQLNEANDVIKTTNQITGNIDLSQFDYEHRRKIDSITTETDSYLEKYNVS